MEKLLLIALLFMSCVIIGYFAYCAYLMWRYTEKIRIVIPLAEFYEIQAMMGNLYGGSEYCIKKSFGKRYDFKFANLGEVCRKLDDFVQQALYYNNKLCRVTYGVKFVKDKNVSLEKMHNRLKELQEKLPVEGS